MKIKLENIEILEKAEVNLDGLTVIGGLNDSGKSTVGKALMALIKADNIARMFKENENFKSDRIRLFRKQVELLFEDQIHRMHTNRSLIELKHNQDLLYSCLISRERNPKKDVGFINFDQSSISSYEDYRIFTDCTFIQTPLIWELYDFFDTITTSREEASLYFQAQNLKYPYTLFDIYKKLKVKREQGLVNIDLIEKIKTIIGGDFTKSDLNKYRFAKKDQNAFEQNIELMNTATGIKYFGLLQVLLKNGYFDSECFFIFDEPENHLHPNWQVKFAELIVEIIVKMNAKILIASHSHYMIEALECYSKKYQLKDKANFYFADNGCINNESSLEKVYEKLAEPFDTLDKLDIEALNNAN